MARFNRIVTNPIQGVYAWALPPWTVVVHRGRRTGRLYRTPVVAFRHGRTLAMAVLYGSESDWVRNLLAGGGQVVRAGRTYELREARLVARDGFRELPAPARLMGRLSGLVLVGELGGPLPGAGRGPRP